MLQARRSEDRKRLKVTNTIVQGESLERRIESLNREIGHEDETSNRRRWEEGECEAQEQPGARR